MFPFDRNEKSKARKLKQKSGNASQNGKDWFPTLLGEAACGPAALKGCGFKPRRCSTVEERRFSAAVKLSPDFGWRSAFSAAIKLSNAAGFSP
jgi:hypothetical protein